VPSLPLAKLYSIGGAFTIDSVPMVSSIVCPNLVSVSGGIGVNGLPAVTTVQMNEMTTAGGFALTGAGALVQLGLRKLSAMTGGFYLGSCGGAPTFDIPVLASVGGAFTIELNTFANLQSFEGLQTVTGDFTLKQNRQLKTLSGFQNLTTINGGVYILGNDVLTSLDAVSRVQGTIKALFLQLNAKVPTFSMNISRTTQNFEIYEGVFGLLSFPNLTNTGKLAIISNPVLQCLSMPVLRTTSLAEIGNSPSLAKCQVNAIAARTGSITTYNLWDAGTFEDDVMPLLDRISSPTLIVAGELDFICGPVWNRPIADGIRGARYVEIPDVGHLPRMGS